MRSRGLDFLRGIAILLVICRHESNSNILYFIGWAGVDLFFVLSGFLVSGLVFREYIKENDVDIKRFLIRRGLKIYPSFYFFVIVSVVICYFKEGCVYSSSQVLNEIFYLQNYRDGIWSHTWSLAVEEHFYLLLALLMFIGIKLKIIKQRRIVTLFLCSLLLLTFAMRFYVSYANRDAGFFAFRQTHLRMDGIVTGVLTSYLYHFNDFYKRVIANKYWFLSLAAIFVSPLFIYPGGSYMMNTIGLSSLNLGFAIFVLFSIKGFHGRYFTNFTLMKMPILTICFIGIHSYSIYLWHLAAGKIVDWMEFSDGVSFVLAIGITLLIGVTISNLIEKPILKLRDKYY